MRTYGKIMLAVAMLALCVWSVMPAVAQDIEPPKNDPAPPADTSENPKEEPKIAPPKAQPDDSSNLEDILQGMTPEQIEELVRKAAEMRLTTEREQVAAEIDASLMFNPGAKTGAKNLLTEKPANTQKDNIERICSAYAKVDGRFDAAMKLYAEGKFVEAAEGFKKLITKEVSYYSAAKGYLHADSLYKAGAAMTGTAEQELAGRKLMWQAIDAYLDMLDNMPDRVSFSASAAINCAEIYDRMGRGIYAMEMYTFCVKNFALTLDKEQVDTIEAKAKKLSDLYKDPLASVGKMMGSVKERLDKIDSGKETQDTEKQIVALLDDLIKTTEEKQKEQSKSESKSPEKGKKEGEPKEGEGEGEPKEGEGKEGKEGKGKGKGPAAGLGQPSSPATESSLPGGSGGRPKNTTAHSGEDGEWAELAPRDREKLEAARKKVMSERYRNLNSDYFRRLAEERAVESARDN